MLSGTLNCWKRNVSVSRRETLGGVSGHRLHIVKGVKRRARLKETAWRIGRCALARRSAANEMSGAPGWRRVKFLSRASAVAMALACRSKQCVPWHHRWPARGGVSTSA